MLTLKFGGTSMADAGRILGSADIIIGRAKDNRLSVIASAAAGVSNSLQASVDACTTGKPYEEFVEKLRILHSKICDDIKIKLPNFDCCSVKNKLEPLFVEYEKLLSGCAAFGECPDTVYCRIMGLGELLSTPILEQVLACQGFSVNLLDSRKFIFTTGNQKEGDPDYVKTTQSLAPYKDGGF